MAAADAVANAGKTATNAVSGAFGFVARNWGKVVAFGGVCLLTAALVTAPGSAAGVAAFAGKSVGATELAGGVVEGVVEGSTKLAEGATWVAGKIGSTAAAAPGVMNG